MSPNAASTEARKHLRLLAGELRVDLDGISDDDLNIVAIRFVLDGRVTTAALQAIVDDVRVGSGQATEVQSAMALPLTPIADDSQEPALPPVRSLRKMHYLSTEATAAKMRHRLSLAHHAEDSRTALRIPRRPELLPVNVPHPACLVAAREREGTVCQRCTWLLLEDSYTEMWMDRDD